jgi:hypothetical protein
MKSLILGHRFFACNIILFSFLSSIFAVGNHTSTLLSADTLGIALIKALKSLDNFLIVVNLIIFSSFADDLPTDTHMSFNLQYASFRGLIGTTFSISSFIHLANNLYASH